ncbi:alpha/beta-hydrolase [Aspergillus egyptiacus]|nr:alpha/beta-hydrolase [Aspergillus egyptiacus]
MPSSSPSPSPSPFTITEHVIEAQHIREYPHATRTGNDALKLVVKQYTPKSNPNPRPGDLTLIGTHGSGFPKELYEPMWEELHTKLSKYGLRIRSIWIADTANQASSGILNAEILGNDPSWNDHARDLLYMINQFKAEMPRPIVGIGHSMGAGQLTLLSLLHPRLFTSLILLDPVMGRDINRCMGPIFVKLSLARRDTWSSREEAEEYFRKKFKKWDPRVLERWMNYGLRELDTCGEDEEEAAGSSTAVTLATSPDQEVVQYLRPNFENKKQLSSAGDRGDVSSDSASDHDATFHPDIIGSAHLIFPFYRAEPLVAWKLLKHVRPSVLYLFGGRSPVSRAESRAEKIERTGRGIGGSGGYKLGKVKEVVIPGAGHHLPFEEVSSASDEMVEWVREVMRRFGEEEERIARGWVDASRQRRTSVAAEWNGYVEEALKTCRKGAKL